MPNRFEWCIFWGSCFVKGSSGVLLAGAFFVFLLCICSFSCALLYIWAKMCVSLGWGIDVSFIQMFLPILPIPATHATATIPPSIWVTQSGRFLLPFMSCWKPPSLALNFSSVQLSRSSKAATGCRLVWVGLRYMIERPRGEEEEEESERRRRRKEKYFVA